MRTFRATRTASPGMTPTAPPSLKPARLDADAAAYANRLAEDWRGARLGGGPEGAAGRGLAGDRSRRRSRGAARRCRLRADRQEPEPHVVLRMPPLAAPRDTAGTRAG